MTPEEAITRIEFIANKAVSDWSNVMVEIASSANTMLKDRIISKGQNAEGEQFDPYSTTPMLANKSGMTESAYNKKAGSKAKRKELKWVTLQRGGKNIRLFELAGGYKEFRELHGRQTNYVDFAFSGRMWADVQVVSTDEEHKLGRARISTLTEEQMTKLAGNTERKGTILDLSTDETHALARVIENRLTEMWRQQGFI